MRNEENPQAGGSETGDACRQKKWREFFKKVPPLFSTPRSISETVFTNNFPSASPSGKRVAGCGKSMFHHRERKAFTLIIHDKSHLHHPVFSRESLYLPSR